MQPRVLVVEDEAALLTLLRYNLEKEGFAVAEARDGEEALLQLKEDGEVEKLGGGIWRFIPEDQRAQEAPAFVEVDAPTEPESLIEETSEDHHVEHEHH